MQEQRPQNCLRHRSPSHHAHPRYIHDQQPAIISLKSPETLKYILSNQGRSRAASALLLIAFPLWLCFFLFSFFFKVSTEKAIKALLLNSYHCTSEAALTPEVYIFSFQNMNGKVYTKHPSFPIPSFPWGGVFVFLPDLMKGWGSYSTNTPIKVAHTSLEIQRSEGGGDSSPTSNSSR